MENKLNTERLSSPVKGCWKDINFGETLVLTTDAMAKKKRKRPGKENCEIILPLFMIYSNSFFVG